MVFALPGKGRWASALVAIAGLASCSRCGCRSSASVASYDGGTVTLDDVRREGLRLPPILRGRLETEAGRQDLASAIIDRRLLVAEARRLDLNEDPDLRRQVADLEEHLLVQALVRREEKRAGAPTDAELRAWYSAHRDELATPERVHLRRILVAISETAAPAERARARARAERFAARLRGGERFEKVAAEADGPERGHGGDLGLLARGQGKDARLEAVAFGLTVRGARSSVQPVAGGLAIVELVERRPPQTPTMEEARGEVANRLEAQRRRKTFDALLARLRAEAHARVASTAGPR